MILGKFIVQNIRTNIVLLNFIIDAIVAIVVANVFNILIFQKNKDFVFVKNKIFALIRK